MPQTEDLDSLLAGIRAAFDVEFEPLRVDDSALEVLTIRNMQAHVDGLLQRKAIRDPLRDLPFWAKIWPGSFVLGRLLRKHEPEGKNLLELGAGCGILSMVAARYGFARIVLSDIVEDALRFAKANVLRNNLQDRVEVLRVDVTTPGRDPRFREGFNLMAASPGPRRQGPVLHGSGPSQAPFRQAGGQILQAHGRPHRCQKPG